MCGIYTSISKKETLCSEFLVSLKELEYRGYDSAGITILDNNKYKTYKTLQKISDLKSKIPKLNSSKLIMGHTRWATHGEPNLKNCHPHVLGNLSIVHNGVVENYEEIKNSKYLKKIKLKTETDTEVILQLIKFFNYSDSFINSILKTFNIVKGSYAFICSKISNNSNEVIACKYNTPLYYGQKLNGDNIFSSDINAMKKSLKGYRYIENDEFIYIENNKPKIFCINKKRKKLILKKIENTDQNINKKIKKNITYSEIKEQKKLISNHIFRVDNISNIIKKIPKPKEIVIIGCGSSYNAGLLGKIFFEENTDIPTSVYRPSEFNYFSNNKKKLFIFMSQSGETADVCTLLESNRDFFKNSLSLVNNNDSRLVRESKNSINLAVGIEQGVAATKTFSSQIITLNIISKLFNKKKDKENILLPKISLLNKVFKLEKNIKEIAKKFYKNKNFFVLGRNYNFPIAKEAALKIKEIAYIHAEGALSSEIKHGPIALFDKDFPVVLLISNKVETVHSEIASLNEIVSRTRNVLVIAPEKIINKLNLKIRSKLETISVPESEDDIIPISFLIVLQLFSYYLAKFKKLPIDQPRNLAKVVTVE